MDKKRLILPGILTVLLLVEEIIKKYPQTIENAYSKGVYPVIIRSLNRVSGWVPFSLFEAMLCLLFGGLAIGLAVLGWRLLKKRKHQVNWIHGGLRVLSLILGFVVLFNVLWGFNYYRLPLAEQLGVTISEHTTDELAALCEGLIRDANELSFRVDRDDNGVMKNRGSLDEVFSGTEAGFAGVRAKLPLFTESYGSPKSVWNSVMMSYIGIAGMYSPLTGEANVNGLLTPALLPATAMHEVAHVYGYAREDEANFIAWLACRYHPDADYQYSGALLGLIYGMNALNDVDPDKFKRLKQDYSAGVKADLEANRDFWKQYEGPAEEIHEQVNDRYLKANGQSDGTASYGRMVDLLLEVSGGGLEGM